VVEAPIRKHGIEALVGKGQVLAARLDELGFGATRAKLSSELDPFRARPGGRRVDDDVTDAFIEISGCEPRAAAYVEHVAAKRLEEGPMRLVIILEEFFAILLGDEIIVPDLHLLEL
jgi:hypothetical protein